jgi:hypothetical protein
MELTNLNLNASEDLDNQPCFSWNKWKVSDNTPTRLTPRKDLEKTLSVDSLRTSTEFSLNIAIKDDICRVEHEATPLKNNIVQIKGSIDSIDNKKKIVTCLVVIEGKELKSNIPLSLFEKFDREQLKFGQRLKFLYEKNGPYKTMTIKPDDSIISKTNIQLMLDELIDAELNNG